MCGKPREKIISWGREKNKGKFWDLKAEETAAGNPAAVCHTIRLSLTWAS